MIQFALAAGVTVGFVIGFITCLLLYPALIERGDTES
jgi:hypothetical protein